MIYENGNQYLGQWYEDKREGLGTYKYANGAIVDGYFEADQPNGGCSVTLLSGKTKYVRFEKE